MIELRQTTGCSPEKGDHKEHLQTNSNQKQGTFKMANKTFTRRTVLTTGEVVALGMPFVRPSWAATRQLRALMTEWHRHGGSVRYDGSRN